MGWVEAGDSADMLMEGADIVLGSKGPKGVMCTNCLLLVN